MIHVCVCAWVRTATTGRHGHLRVSSTERILPHPWSIHLNHSKELQINGPSRLLIHAAPFTIVHSCVCIKVYQLLEGFSTNCAIVRALTIITSHVYTIKGAMHAGVRPGSTYWFYSLPDYTNNGCHAVDAKSKTSYSQSPCPPFKFSLLSKTIKGRLKKIFSW